MIETIEQLFAGLRASGFSTSLEIDPPVGDVPLHIGEIPLPIRLTELYHSVASRVHGRYECLLTPKTQDEFGSSFVGVRLVGGPLLLSPTELVSTKIDMLKWALQSWVANDTDEQTCWIESVPFAAMDNGDYLAFDEFEQVIYLDCNGESFVLDADFSEFWEKWERLFFVGPELWVFEPFWSEYGLLVGNLENVARFRDVFTSLLDSSPAT